MRASPSSSPRERGADPPVAASNSSAKRSAGTGGSASLPPLLLPWRIHSLPLYLIQLCRHLEDEHLHQQGRAAHRRECVAHAPSHRALDLTISRTVWEVIRPKALKILEKNKAARFVADAASLTKDRQSRLRTAYQTLHAAEPEDVAHSFPIFGDFLQFPSVKPFWEPIDATFVQIQWDAVVSDIQLEVAEHRESTRIHAIKQILLATTNVTETDLDEDDVSFDGETYGSQFFSAATSFLFCTIAGCRHKPQNSWHWYGMADYVPDRGTFFSSLPDLLAHQHELHADSRFDEPCDGHFEIPEFVADVLASLADAIDVERTQLLPTYLQPYYFRWKNASAKRGKWYSDWRALARPSRCCQG